MNLGKGRNCDSPFMGSGEGDLEDICWHLHGIVTMIIDQYLPKENHEGDYGLISWWFVWVLSYIHPESSLGKNFLSFKYNGCCFSFYTSVAFRSSLYKN